MTTDQLTTLVDVMILWDTEAGAPFPFPNETLDHLRSIRQAADQNNVDALLRILGNRLDGELARTYAAANLSRYLHQTPSPDLSHAQHKTIADSLANALKTETSLASRSAIIRALQAVQHPDALQTLINTLRDSPEPDFRATVASVIRTHTDPWNNKLPAIIATLDASKLYRVHLDAAAILTACLPPITTPANIAQDHQALINALIEQANRYHNDERMTGILAALITESCGRNLNRADALISQYIANATPPVQLDSLRLEINATVTPAELHHTLDSRFYLPLKQKQDQLHTIWNRTIWSAQISLWGRLIITLIIQIMGGVFTILSTYNLLTQGVKNEYTIGIIVGVSLIALSLLFQNVITSTRETLTEIGIANAAYLAFFHRTLQISTGYAQQFLKGQLTPESITTSSKLVQEALEATVKAMNPDQPTLDDLINRL